jgi:hypothetical protein
MNSATPSTIDPATAAIESYIDATGGGGPSAGFPWGLAIGLVVVVGIMLALTVQVRRRAR